MASTTKRRFTEEFKREAVALWEMSGRKQAEVAAELGVMPTMLRRELDRARMERDILKKAVGIPSTMLGTGFAEMPR